MKNKEVFQSKPKTTNCSQVNRWLEIKLTNFQSTFKLDQIIPLDHNQKPV